MEGTKRKRKSSVERNVIYHVGIPCTLPCIFNLQLPKSLHVSSENRMGVGYQTEWRLWYHFIFHPHCTHTRHTLSYSHAHVLHICCINESLCWQCIRMRVPAMGRAPRPFHFVDLLFHWSRTEIYFSDVLIFSLSAFVVVSLTQEWTTMVVSCTCCKM